MPSTLTPLFIRLPKTQADALSRLASETGRTKQHLVSELVRQALPAPPRPLAVGRAEVFSNSQERDDEVLTLGEVATLLKVSDEVVRSRAEQGALPARRIGSDWRFSRLAVLTWLAEGDSSKTRRRR